MERVIMILKMAKLAAAVLIVYTCLLNVCYGQTASSQAACFPHVSSIPYPAYEWGAGSPIRVTVEFKVRSDGHFEIFRSPRVALMILLTR